MSWRSSRRCQRSKAHLVSSGSGLAVGDNSEMRRRWSLDYSHSWTWKRTTMKIRGEGVVNIFRSTLFRLHAGRQCPVAMIWSHVEFLVRFSIDKYLKRVYLAFTGWSVCVFSSSLWPIHHFILWKVDVFPWLAVLPVKLKQTSGLNWELLLSNPTKVNVSFLTGRWTGRLLDLWSPTRQVFFPQNNRWAAISQT